MYWKQQLFAPELLGLGDSQFPRVSSFTRFARRLSGYKTNFCVLDAIFTQQTVSQQSTDWE